jgi:hypothetical protein
MDLITPLPKPLAATPAGLLNVIERLSKLIRIVAIPTNVVAPDVARLFHTHVYRNQGLALEIISVRDPIS